MIGIRRRLADLVTNLKNWFGKSRINAQLLLMTNYYCSLSYIFYGEGGGQEKGKLGEWNLERIRTCGFAYKNAHCPSSSNAGHASLKGCLKGE